MKKLFKEKGKRLLALFLSILTAVGIMPTTVFAFSPSEGQKVSSYYGDYYVGSDGGYYYSADSYSYLVYDSSGNTTVRTSSGGNPRKKYMISDGSEARQVYCIESGIAYGTSDNGYTSQSGKNSAYFQNLPYAAQYGIMLTSVYGWQTGKGSPVPGTNEDDYAIATQILMWEYQQQLRTSPQDLHASPAGIRGDNYLRTIDGRPAKQCYDWILAQMAQHATIPSFASDRSSSAQVHTLKYNPETKKYSLTLTDTNNTGADLKFSGGNGISVNRSGNKYTFTSSRMLTSAETLTVQKNVPGVGNDMLIWGRVGFQTMMCGADDPVVFYVKIDTETYGTGHIKKTSEDGKVSGISFHITGNGVDKTVKTKADGTVDIQLMPGTYTVTEQDIDKYEPQKSQKVTIVSGQTSTVTFNNKLKRGSLEVIKTSEDKFVKDMTFHLYGTSLSGLPVDEYAVTDASGVARFENVLISGSTPYTLEEVNTPVRYVVPASQTAPVQWNVVTKRSFTNILKKFRVEVTKTDRKTGYAQGDASLAGAVYGLYQDGKLVASYTTDTTGSFTSDYFICNSNWTLREISPSEGYLLDETIYPIPAEPGNFTVELNQIPIGVTEEVIMGRIRLVKHIDAELEDLEKAETQTETQAENAAEPAEEEHDEAVQAVSTVSGGDAQTEPELEADAALSQETEDKNDAEATVSGGNAQTDTDAEETIEDTEIEMVPETEPTADPYAPVPVPPEDIEASGKEGIIEQPEEGAKFQIYLASAGSYDAAREDERDILTTDADGFAVSKDLPYGRYVVHQTEGMEGQAFIPDFIVYIRTDDQTYSYILNNTTQSSFIRVEKHDAETGKIIPAAGVGFQVRDLSTGDLIAETLYYPTPVTIDTFFTNEEGWLMLPYELSYGQYELIEVETCYGYVLDSNPVPFTVDGTQDVVVVEKHNMPQKGKIVVAKTGEVFASVTTSDGADKDGADLLYQPVYEIRGLEGATYEIRAAEDIYTPDGTLRAAKGDVVDTVTTGSGGAVSSKELYLGKYEVVETKAPYGMVLNPNPQQVELVYAGQEVDLTETAAGVYNERQKVELSLEKTLELSEEFGIGTNNELANITFGLYAAEDLTAADGSVIPADGLLEIVSLDADGKGIAQTDLPLGSYYLKEHSTDAHYILSGTKYPVTFAYGDQETAVVTIAANDGEPIVNELIYGSVSGKKLDEDGEGLGGAKIGLFAPSAKEFTEETAILVTTSAEDGSFRFEDIPYGLWIVREIEQPEGFVLSTDLFPVAVNEDGQVIEIEITNEFIRGNLHLTKFDKDYPENKLSGAVFEVYRDTNGNKELDKDDELLGIMEETEKGQYEMKDLLYGGVLVREKTAPDGFYLDENVYYVMIDTDGKTYEIENEAGKGFYNQAHRGNLKIVKTSSDGRVEGFSFRVVGDNYDQTFKTDANGEIFIENLRVGKYTVTEVEDSVSAGYKRPDPVTVELVVDETLTVNVHNDKITVDVPKTGDTSNLWLWIGLMAAGISGMGVCAYGLRKRKKNKA
ncbi:MAG: Cys-Gln thioester bond-forming surface protein [Lachnospiraceae bacterium]|nr:Cys-Gln thioester bond-forming surface protein [Lachnospiraceae bacterium]